MLPVIALVGRPNVGKSTVFNVLTRSRDALVADQPGVTRDRQYGYGRVDDRRFIVIDTGGLLETPRGVEQAMAEQTRRAIDEADHVVFVVDGREGLTEGDRFVAGVLRRGGKAAVLAVNKSEGRDDEMAVAEFHALGLGEPIPISAAHSRGMDVLIQAVLGEAPEEPDAIEAEGALPRAIRVCVVGRPNVGKSTLINRLLGEERLVAFDQPGT
ncbi:MAG: GTPase, partial [Steroidobacteraceae bacterium]